MAESNKRTMRKITIASILITLIANFTIGQSVNIDDYKLPEETDYYNAWIKSKAAVSYGDTIFFGEKVYNIDIPTGVSGWYLEKSGITLQGAGMNKTFLTAGPKVGVTMSGAGRLGPSFVRGYYYRDTAFTFTYFKTTKKGDRFIKLKKKSYTDSINVGDKMTLTGGSHYFDQDFGELVTITRKNKDTLFLKDKLSGAYSVDSVPYNSILSTRFIMPEIGQSVIAYINPASENILWRLISIGDNVFYVIDYSLINKTVTVVNIGRGNAVKGQVVPALSKVMKARVILLWKHTQDLKINDLTITGQQNRVLRLDNSYGVELNNVKVTRSSPIRDGYVYTTDFCRNIKFNNCIFESLIAGSASQISRSAGDISFFKCRFIDTRTDCSEYSFNLKFDSCIFDMNLRGYNFALGGTVRRSEITNCTFNVDSTGGVISALEIQSLKKIQREYALIKGNTFNIKRYADAIVDLSVFGENWFINNTIQGSGAIYTFAGSLNRRETGVGLYPHFDHVDSNNITIRFTKAFCVLGMNSGKISNNYIKNTGLVKVPVFLGYSTGVKGALISYNTFDGFTSPIYTTTNVTLLNNTIK